MEKLKKIALIAHDGKKQEIMEWALKNKEILKHFKLCGTGTTANRVEEYTGLKVEGFMSGPLGGDQQIGAKVAEGEIGFIIFLCDPLTAQPHDPDVKALLRIAVLYNVPIATNIATADYVITSNLLKF